MNKKYFPFFIITFCLFFLSICFEMDFFRIEAKRLAKVERAQIDQKDHSFVIIIPSYNCSELITKIFKSLCSQTYNNFKVFFIDDGSTDNTYEKAKENEHILHNIEYTIIRNDKHKGSTECLYEIAQTLNDDQIILFFQGNCWLKHNNTLEIFNSYYKRYDVWLAYSQYENYRTKKLSNIKYISSNNIFSNSARRKPWKRSRIKSFSAGLFKKIPISNFFFRGRFIHERFDCAYMFPMLEMAKNHIAFLNEAHCNYVQKGSKDETRPSFSKNFKCMQEILRRKPLHPLKKLKYKNTLSDQKSDILIFSYDRPLQLYSLLESIYKKMENFEDIAVLYRTSNNAFEKGYTYLKETFPKTIFVKQKSSNSDNNFKELTLKTLNLLSSAHLMFAVDDMIVKDKVNLSFPIKEMDRTGAYFFALRLGNHIKYCYMGGFEQAVPNNVKINNNMMAWQIDAARGDWNYYPSVDMTIFHKSHIMKIFPKIAFKHPVELEQNWLKHYKKFNKRSMIRQIGLSFNQSKVVNIPINVVCESNRKNLGLYTKEELLKKFEEGYKIDIDPLEDIKNYAVHVEYMPIFIKRDG
jgi:glycosyltransferase involved in cell wall biosynthesis